MKFKDPTKGKGMRTLYLEKQVSKLIWLVDLGEPFVDDPNVKYLGVRVQMMKMENPRQPYRTGNILLHGLICCKL